MSESTSQGLSAGRAIAVLTTCLWILTSPWILQAFVPEPYFLRTAHQLKDMSTPNGFGKIERSLSPLFMVIGIEVAILMILAALSWHFRNAAIGVIYLLAVIAMAAITLWRLNDALSGFT